MIAKQEWFSRRKYTGWGLSPKTWQGWVYVAGFVVVVTGVNSLPMSQIGKMWLTLVAVIVLLIDVFLVMASIKLDEREQKIEALAERNASWTMVTALASALLYVATIGRALPGIELMPVLIFPLLAGVVAKGLTNYILEKRGI